ncbi:homocysteine S-methyltransferas-like protein, partial [Byssothecium circinans]
MSSPTSPPRQKLSTVLTTTNTPIVLDGALATYLETQGADISTPLWSAHLLHTNPSLIKKAHYDYFAAGADIATTCSYQASIPGLIEHLGISEADATAMIKKSVELAQEARDEYLHEQEQQRQLQNLYIAGSIGPYGAYLSNGAEYRGDYSLPEETLRSFHLPRITSLIAAGIDILAIETLPSFPETHALLSLLSTSFPSTPAYFSFTLRPSSPTHISDGTPLSRVASLLNEYDNVVAVGVNCVAPGVALEGLRELRRWTRKPLVVYANSGEVWNAGTRGWEGGRREGGEVEAWTRKFWEAGARVVGGCCRTGPGDIRVISGVLRGI